MQWDWGQDSSDYLTPPSPPDSDWRTSVQFEAPSGDIVRFSATDQPGELEEWLCTPSESNFFPVGIATELFMTPGPSGMLTDQNGAGGALPRDDHNLIFRLRDLCEQCGVPLYVTQPDCEPPLTAPSWSPEEAESSSAVREQIYDGGEPVLDMVEFCCSDQGARARFVATAGRRGELQQFLTDGAEGAWAPAGVATALVYDRQTGTISNQDGGGGKLPPEREFELVSALRRCAIAAGVPFSVRGPDPTESRRRARRLGLRRQRALIVGTCGAAGAAGVAQVVTQLAELVRRQLPSVALRVLCEGTLALPTRRAVLKALHWLSHGADPGDTVVLGLVCKGYPDAWRAPGRDAETTAALNLQCSDGLVITGREVRAVAIDPLPPGSWLSVVCDSVPPAAVLNLPYKAVGSPGGLRFGETTALTPAVRCGVVQLSLVQGELASMPGSAERRPGALTRALCAALGEKRPAPSYAALLQALRAALPFGEPMISASCTFDALTDCFALGAPRPRRAARKVLDNAVGLGFWQDFVRVFQTAEPPQRKAAARTPPAPRAAPAGDAPLPNKQQQQGAGSPPPADWPPLQRKLHAFYSRHAPEKCRLVPTLVREFPGSARELLEQLARKYGDTTVLEEYSPRWDAPKTVGAEGAALVWPQSPRLSPPPSRRALALQSPAATAAVERRHIYAII